ncbi:MAG: PAS domain S-box protein [Spirochaetales bacterium]|nr:PAS domain S-box protein [Spirochaetales bacterium]
MRFESLRHYRELINTIPDIIYQIDPDGIFQFLGSAVAILGYSPKELLGRHFSDIVHPGDAAVLSRLTVDREADASGPRVFFDDRRTRPRLVETSEIRLIPKRLAGRPGPPDAEGLVYGELSARGYYEIDDNTGEKQFLGTIGIIRDISRRKKAEGFLRKLLWAVDQTPVSIIITDADFIVEYINPEFIRDSGFSPQEIIGQRVGVLESHYHPEEFYDQIKKALLTAGEWTGELVNRKKNGTYYWTSVMISAVRDPNGVVTNYISIQEDITEKKNTAEQIKSLREKEILLREIHHRVKNNLQIITSLLSLQSGTLTDERFIDIFKKSENRIKTMALIHEKLYQSHDIARIDFGDYIKSLLIHLQQAHREALARIKITTDLQSIYFDIDTAIPAGLIINELVTNAFFHGFPDGASGEIKVTLRERENYYFLEVSNSGRTIPEDADVQSSPGLGLQLVRLLTKQVHGTFKLTRKPRTVFRVVIPASA